MKNRTPIVVILVLILSFTVWKAVDNHKAIQTEKELQRAQEATPISKVLGNNHPTPQGPSPENQISHKKSNTETKSSNSKPSKFQKILVNPDEPLEEGYEWTDEYYDPDRLDEPGYREKVMKHLHAKHYYESPQRRMPAFKQSRALLDQWEIEPSMENIVFLHDAAAEWHRNLYYAEMDTGPAAGPKAKERAIFMTEFKKESIRGRFKDLFGIEDKDFMEAFVEIKPDRPILGPKLKIKPGQRLMKRTR
ncbi:hypothetical protein OAM01_00155 [bacterium]|nr:hypothetical protein [bacterium]